MKEEQKKYNVVCGICRAQHNNEPLPLEEAKEFAQGILGYTCYSCSWYMSDTRVVTQKNNEEVAKFTNPYV